MQTLLAKLISHTSQPLSACRGLSPDLCSGLSTAHQRRAVKPRPSPGTTVLLQPAAAVCSLHMATSVPHLAAVTVKAGSGQKSMPPRVHCAHTHTHREQKLVTPRFYSRTQPQTQLFLLPTLSFVSYNSSCLISSTAWSARAPNQPCGIPLPRGWVSQR